MRTLLAGVSAAVLISGLHVAAQSPPAPSFAPHVVSLLHFIHATGTLEPTLAFYHDVFGFDAPMPRVNNSPGVALLNNAPGIGLRATRPIFPNERFGIEFTEFSKVERKPAQALPTDPGAIELILPVRDIAAVYAAAKKRGAPIVSTGGPVMVSTPTGAARALVMRDPDGYLVRAVEVPASAATLPGLLQPGVSLGVAVKDMDETARYYRETMGFEVTGSNTFARDDAMARLVGASGRSEYRQMWTHIPGTSAARIEFYDWKGMTRTPFHQRVPDPGAGGLVMQVTDLDRMVAGMKARGTPTLTPTPIWFSDTIWDIFVTDPNGMNLELFEIKSGGRGAGTRGGGA
jgi:catechol 2,3-dioxygenase-like lactoylglutathione lyase family enzyme